MKISRILPLALFIAISALGARAQGMKKQGAKSSSPQQKSMATNPASKGEKKCCDRPGSPECKAKHHNDSSKCCEKPGSEKCVATHHHRDTLTSQEGHHGDEGRHHGQMHSGREEQDKQSSSEAKP